MSKINYFKKRNRMKKVRNLDSFDLYFEELPAEKIYKLQRWHKRKMRKLKPAF